ncbi:hypothetical protein MXB_1352 [Myxobolus squamalis]|nr:hypothetical protein MXB_1352 [Myxobolus squamalis]
MGKNTLFKKGFQARSDKAKFERVMTQLFGNIGMFFTNKGLKEMRDLMESVSEMAPVKANMVAQCDVVIPKGVTGLAPDKTSFFQALNIPTMINKVNIEILSDINLLKNGQRVGASEAVLMQMLNIRPFSYKLHTKYIYDNGLCYPPSVLDIKQEDILASFKSAISEIACITLAIGYPTSVSVPHMVQNSLKELIAICLEADISNTIIDEFKESVANSVFTAPQPKVEAEPESEDEDADLGALFD